MRLQRRIAEIIEEKGRIDVDYAFSPTESS
jgi:hypothetical protein